MSLPSSPHEYRDEASGRSEPSGYGVNNEMESTWNKVLESPMFNNKPLLPYEEWNIDFSEITVGTRVGIGKYYVTCHCDVNHELQFAHRDWKLCRGQEPSFNPLEDCEPLVLAG